MFCPFSAAWKKILWAPGHLMTGEVKIYLVALFYMFRPFSAAWKGVLQALDNDNASNCETFSASDVASCPYYVYIAHPLLPKGSSAIA